MSFSIPLKFTLGSKVFNGLPDNCTASETRTENKTVTSYTGTAGALTVTAELTQYSDFDAREWVVYFKNNTDAESEILSDVLAVSMDFDFSDAKLYTCNGDFYSYDGYETTEHDIHANSGFVFEQAPVGGRACDRAFPYQRLVSGTGGFNIAIGWPGQWFCRWEENGGKIHLDAGQQRVHTVLHPGETFRTPLIALVGFEGGLESGINVWRRWYRKYVLPKNAEPILHGVDNAGGQEFCSTTQEQQLESIKGFIQNGTGINMWWIDAGWYPAITPEGEENWWKTTGTWECDKNRFPNGFRPISDYCAQHSVKLMIWFEVERANEGTKLFAEHPEWLVKNTDEPVRYGFMLDMGNEACVDYLSKYIADFLIENNISIYRQDYNFEPLPYWQHNETSNRVGMNENRCVCGYLRYWDYLLEHVPGLLIDSCASGGRRNDLETVRRAIVLHQTDAAYGNHPVKHAFFQTLYTWIPYFRGFMDSWEDENGEYVNEYPFPATSVDEYNLLSALAPCMNLNADCGKAEYAPRVKSAVSVWRRISPYLLDSDFYALTPYHKSRKKWTCWQFDRPEKGEGVFEVIRNNAAAQGELTVHTPVSGTLELENLVTGEKMTASGSVTFRQPLRSVTVWKYKIV